MNDTPQTTADHFERVLLNDEWQLGVLVFDEDDPDDVGTLDWTDVVAIGIHPDGTLTPITWNGPWDGGHAAGCYLSRKGEDVIIRPGDCSYEDADSLYQKLQEQKDHEAEKAEPKAEEPENGNVEKSNVETLPVGGSDRGTRRGKPWPWA